MRTGYDAVSHAIWEETCMREALAEMMLWHKSAEAWARTVIEAVRESHPSLATQGEFIFPKESTDGLPKDGG